LETRSDCCLKNVHDHSTVPNFIFSNKNCINEQTVSVWNVNHVADERNSISGNIGDADVINHYFADVPTDASYDRQAVTNFL